MSLSCIWCDRLGNHSRHCPASPSYVPWSRRKDAEPLAVEAPDPEPQRVVRLPVARWRRPKG